MCGDRLLTLSPSNSLHPSPFQTGPEENSLTDFYTRPYPTSQTATYFFWVPSLDPKAQLHPLFVLVHLALAKEGGAKHIPKLTLIALSRILSVPWRVSLTPVPAPHSSSEGASGAHVAPTRRASAGSRAAHETLTAWPPVLRRRPNNLPSVQFAPSNPLKPSIFPYTLRPSRYPEKVFPDHDCPSN